ncbi:hypothetical protein H9P43_004973 [Blastocladiella emersonii ATCC 22665]|nr:hypothetical protein H9P43_004973 [Blastocladiella emersonii ATCC 22665]
MSGPHHEQYDDRARTGSPHAASLDHHHHHPPPPPAEGYPTKSPNRKFQLPFADVFGSGSTSPTSGAAAGAAPPGTPPSAAGSDKASPKLRRTPSLATRISRSSQLGQTFRSLFRPQRAKAGSPSGSSDDGAGGAGNGGNNSSGYASAQSPYGDAATYGASASAHSFHPATAGGMAGAAPSPMQPTPPASGFHGPPSAAVTPQRPRPVKRWSAADLQSQVLASAVEEGLIPGHGAAAGPGLAAPIPPPKLPTRRSVLDMSIFDPNAGAPPAAAPHQQQAPPPTSAPIGVTPAASHDSIGEPLVMDEGEVEEPAPAAPSQSQSHYQQSQQAHFHPDPSSAPRPAFPSTPPAVARMSSTPHLSSTSGGMARAASTTTHSSSRPVPPPLVIPPKVQASVAEGYPPSPLSPTTLAMASSPRLPRPPPQHSVPAVGSLGHPVPQPPIATHDPNSRFQSAAQQGPQGGGHVASVSGLPGHGTTAISNVQFGGAGAGARGGLAATLGKAAGGQVRAMSQAEAAPHHSAYEEKMRLANLAKHGNTSNSVTAGPVAAPPAVPFQQTASTGGSAAAAIKSAAAPPAATVAQTMLEKYKLLPEFEQRYVVGDELGSGGFGFVVTASRVSDDLEVAVKFIFKDKVPVHSLVKDPELGVIPMEVYILKNMKHPNIIGFHDFFVDNRFYYLVMELHGVPWKKSKEGGGAGGPAPVTRSPSLQPPTIQRSNTEPAQRPPTIGRRHSMDLFECIEANSRLSEDIARKIFAQVVSAVHHLDSYRIVHRDIKDENIVVDQHFNVKLIDFGSALMVPSNGRLFDRFAGTLQYCPPEVLQGYKYRGPEQEVWALGILLYTVLYSGAPFSNMNQVLHHEVPIPRYSRGPHAGQPRASPDVIELLRWMLQKSPNDRATIGQVMNHRWLKSRPPAAAPVSAPAALHHHHHQYSPASPTSPTSPVPPRHPVASQDHLQPPTNTRLHSSPEPSYLTGAMRGGHAPGLRRANPSANLQELFYAGSGSGSGSQQQQQQQQQAPPAAEASATCSSPTSPAAATHPASAGPGAKRHPLQQEVLPDSPSGSPMPSPHVGRSSRSPLNGNGAAEGASTARMTASPANVYSPSRPSRV